MDVEDNKLVILYATQTGNARDVSERITREAIKRGFKVELSSLEFYEKSKLPNEKYVIFVISTTGQGEGIKIQFINFLFDHSYPSFLRK